MHSSTEEREKRGVSRPAARSPVTRKLEVRNSTGQQQVDRAFLLKGELEIIHNFSKKEKNEKNRKQKHLQKQRDAT